MSAKSSSLTAPSRVTQLLEKFDPEDKQSAEQLCIDVYKEMRAVAAAYLNRERRNHTLQPTALVHEAFLKLVDQTRVNWRGQAHFLGVAAQTMRRILVDHARRRGAAKRGGLRHRIVLDDSLLGQAASEQAERKEDILELEDALNKLVKLDARQAQMVELRFFGGLSIAETAKVMDISERTVEREWTMVRAWLRRELTASESP